VSEDVNPEKVEGSQGVVVPSLQQDGKELLCMWSEALPRSVIATVLNLYIQAVAVSTLMECHRQSELLGLLVDEMPRWLRFLVTPHRHRNGFTQLRVL
jgi:hypothetical protein